MIFASISFLYYFLPFTLILHALLPRQGKNLFLLTASLAFYCLGEPRFGWLLIASCIFHYYYGRLLEHASQPKRKYLLILHVTISFGVLFYFKYFGFFLSVVNELSQGHMVWKRIVLPIGISFYTFQAVSYIIDIYRGNAKSAPDLISFATYLTLFPQLIAGPIIRYKTIAAQLKERKTGFASYAQGIRRFIIGLAKKVLIADVLAALIQRLGIMSSQSVLSCWMSAVAAMLQLYFDFSGYSDMAIGIAAMLGFHFPENFNYPFIAASITDFWRRWHISLSSWFRDYVYIPLGGSRKGIDKQYRNILIVWVLTGIWHGAGWTFMVWGAYFALWLIIEKRFLKDWLKHHPIAAHVYTLFIVLISFVIFHASDLGEAMMTLRNMFGLGDLPLVNSETIYHLRNGLGVFGCAVLFSMPLIPYLKTRIHRHACTRGIWTWSEAIVFITLFLICSAYIIDETFRPFLYFRF